VGTAAGGSRERPRDSRAGAAPFRLPVPILGREGRLVGLLALGPRLSDDPYSGEDKRLLASVASQAGMAIENFRLAEDVAERLEAERRAAARWRSRKRSRPDCFLRPRQF